MKQSNPIGILVWLATFAILPGISAQAIAAGKKPITRDTTKIVRGSNALPCNAQTIGQGNSPSVGPKEDLTNLSVSCSDDKSVSYNELLNHLPHAHGCGSTLDDLRKARPSVTVVSDPTGGNPYHCILDNITPKEFISGIKWQQ